MSRQFYRRLAGHLPQLVGRLRDAVGRVSNDKGTPRDAARAISDAWDAVAAELQSFLAALSASNDAGLPSGSAVGSGISPTTVEAGTAAAIGSEGDGWATAQHQHAALTGAAVELTEDPPAEGGGRALARAAHTHRMAIRAEFDDDELDVVHAINALPPGISLRSEPNTTGTLLDDLWGEWTFDEASGLTRKARKGIGVDLLEYSATLTGSVSGRFRNATDSVEHGPAFPPQGLYATLGSPLAISGGLTIAIYFKWPNWSSNSPKSILDLHNGGTTAFTEPRVAISRFYNSDYLDVGFEWSSGHGVGLPIPRLGPFTQDEWHLLVITYDPATGVLSGCVDDGCLTSAVDNDGSSVTYATPSNRLSATISPADLATANGSTFSTLRFIAPFNSNFVSFEGNLDHPRIWTRCLARAEVQRVWKSLRATVVHRTRYAPHFLFGGR